MNGLAGGWVQIAWHQCWQVTLLIGGVWLVLRIAGKNRPHMACALWLVVLVKCVTPPVVSSPSGIFCWLQPSVASEAPVADAPIDRKLPAASAGDEVVVRATRARGADLASLPMPYIAQPLPAPARAMPGWSWPSPTSCLAAVWLLGAMLFAIVTGSRWWKCWRLLRSAAPADGELAASVDQLRRRIGVRRKVRVLVTDSPLGPAVVGLWRPPIILPAALLTDKSTRQLEPLLAHELTHIRRGDLWIGLLQVLAGGLWWFHPLVRLASRLATREAERCCDEEVIASLGCNPGAYARGLLDVLALKQRLIPIPAFPGVRPVDVTSQRLERIMKLGQGCHRRTPWWCWLVMFLLAAAALPGAAFVAGAKERAKPKPPDPKRYIHADFGAAEDDQAELSERTYDVAEILEMLRQESERSAESARILLTQLVRSTSAAPWVDDKSAAGRWVGLEGGTLRVRQSAARHERIEQQLAVLREHGYAEVSVEVLILSGPTAVLEAKGIDWRMIGSHDGASPFAAEREEDMPRGAVRSVIEKHVPALVALVDRKQADELVTMAQGNAKTHVIQAPKVTLFNGQSARVEDSFQRPYVVGVKPAAGERGPTLEPTVRIFTEGTTIRLRPVVYKDGPVQLDFALTLSSIRDVDMAEFPAGPGREPITVQVPEIATTRLSTTAELNDMQALILSLPKTAGSKNGAQPMCVVVKVKRLDEPQAAQPAPPSTQATRQAEEVKKSVDLPSKSHLKDDVQYFPPDAERAGPAKELNQYEFETSGWKFRAKSQNSAALTADWVQGASPLADLQIRGALWLVGVAEHDGEKRDEVVAQAESLRVTMEPTEDGSPSKLRIVLDGNVRLIHNQSRIDACKVVLQIDRPFVSSLDPGRKPAVFSIQASDAQGIEIGDYRKLPSMNLNGWELRFSSRNGRQPDMRDRVVPGKLSPEICFENGVKISASCGQKTHFDIYADFGVIVPDTGEARLSGNVRLNGVEVRSDEAVVLFGVPIGESASRPTGANRVNVTLAGNVAYVDSNTNKPRVHIYGPLRLTLSEQEHWAFRHASDERK